MKISKTYRYLAYALITETYYWDCYAIFSMTVHQNKMLKHQGIRCRTCKKENATGSNTEATDSNHQLQVGRFAKQL